MFSRHNHNLCTNKALETAAQICIDRELRFTPIRRQVLSLIWENHRASKAYDLLNTLKLDEKPAQPPTIYRALDFLLENGFVHKINSLNAYIGCTHPLKHHQCYFLICSNCNEIKECCSDDLNSVITQTTQLHHFTLSSTTLEIMGKCQQCIKSIQ